MAQPQYLWQSTDLADAQEKIKNYIPKNRPLEQGRENIVEKSLAAFLQYLSPEGRANIAHDINKSKDDEELYETFDNLYKALKARMLAPSKTPSGESFRDILLERDGYCCTVTGDLDQERWVENGCPEDVEAGPLKEAYIIPYSSYTNWDNDLTAEREDMIWQTFYRCFPAVEKMNFKPEDINDLCNRLMLSITIYYFFKTFKFAFKPTDEENVYELEFFRVSSGKRNIMGNKVTFTNHDKTKGHALPSRDLLECHYISAKILHASRMC